MTHRRPVLLACVLACLAAGPARAQAPFLNILPPGEHGLVTAADALAFELNGTRSAHFDDQLAKYANLVYKAPDLTDADLLTYYKDARFGVDPGDVTRTETPRAGVTILRDQFDVAHVTGATRSDVMFGAGYVNAEDRLFLTDVLRHVGRGRESEFLGPCQSAIDMDQSIYRVAGYSEAELQQQIDALPTKFGAIGAQIVQDFTDFTAGMNQYISEAMTDANKMPAEYAAIGQTLQPWKPTDTVAVAVLVQAVFAVGGGGEQDNAALLQALQARYGASVGHALFEDLREKEDPEAPTSASRRFPYPRITPINPAAVAMPDPGSVSAQNPLTVMQQALAAGGLPFPLGMSNWLGVTRQHTQVFHPITVMGPQVGYFVPQILMEVDLHGGGVDARGATFPGIAAYVLLGRGTRYAWSATSGQSDLIDVRAEKLCNPGGGAVDPQSTHYLFRGTCTAMVTRTDSWMSNTSAACMGQPRQVTATVQRTVHGPVFARAKVNGEPVALVQQRSTFFGEPDSAPAFVLLNNNQVTGPRTFQKAISKVTGTFNWLYVDPDNIAYFHSGLYPQRARGVDPDLPSWGTGQFEWQRRFLSFGRHPREVNPRKGFITSWNGKPAPAWNAADNNYAFGPVFRSLSLDERLRAKLTSGTPLTRADMVNAMEDAGSVDLRGSQVLPYALALIGTEPGLTTVLGKLSAWASSGAHRRDKDQSGFYDDQSAVATMDEWYPRMITAVFDGQLSGLYNLIPMTKDDAPGPVGSAYIAGYYGYLQRVFKMALGTSAVSYAQLRCADGTAAGCRAGLVSSLNAAVSALTTLYGSANPDDWKVQATGCTSATQPACDQIEHTVVGIVSVPPIHWINRPTWQQVVQVTP